MADGSLVHQTWFRAYLRKGVTTQTHPPDLTWKWRNQEWRGTREFWRPSGRTLWTPECSHDKIKIKLDISNVHFSRLQRGRLSSCFFRSQNRCDYLYMLSCSVGQSRMGKFLDTTHEIGCLSNVGLFSFAPNDTNGQMDGFSNLRRFAFLPGLPGRSFSSSNWHTR